MSSDYGRLFVWPNHSDDEVLAREFYSKATSRLLDFPIDALVAVCLCRNDLKHFCAVFAFALGDGASAGVDKVVRSFLADAGCPKEQETETAFYMRLMNPLSQLGENLSKARITVLEGKARNLRKPGRPFEFYEDVFPFRNFLSF